jgi:hypothetical protein
MYCPVTLLSTEIPRRSGRMPTCYASACLLVNIRMNMMPIVASLVSLVQISLSLSL